MRPAVIVDKDWAVIDGAYFLEKISPEPLVTGMFLVQMIIHWDRENPPGAPHSAVGAIWADIPGRWVPEVEKP